jgi:hypothetical protein
MQVVSVGVATLLALLLFYSEMNSVPHVSGTPLIKVEVAENITHRTPVDYIPMPHVVAVPDVVPVPPKVVTATPKIVPVPVAIPTPYAPQQDTAVSACLGKFAGALCTFDTHDGSCIALAWSPLTCVPH